MGVLISLRVTLIRLWYALARRRPLQARVVLAASNRSLIDGNLAAIQRELGTRTPPILSVAVAYRPPPGFRGAIGTVLNDLRTTRLLATSRVFVIDDYCLPVYVVKRRVGTRVIRVGHSIGPGRRWGYGNPERTESSSAALMRRVEVHSNYDFCVLGSRNGIASYAEATRMPVERLLADIGIPRTDVLLDPDRHGAALARVRHRYPQLTGRRVVLYAPTYRRVGRRATHPERLDLELLASRLHGDWLLAVRRHPGTREPLAAEGTRAFVVDVSDYPEANELLLATDILVTDYSTIVYDFCLLGRPIAFFTPDHERIESGQGFYVDFTKEGIGPSFDGTDKLAEWLTAGDHPTDGIVAFGRRWLDVADGHASERFVDRLVLPAMA